MELLIKNAKLVDEASELDADILVRNGKSPLWDRAWIAPAR